MKHALTFFGKLLLELAMFALLTVIGTRLAFAQVNINEVMSSPDTGNEWVELWNQSNDEVWLTGWTVEDSASLLTPNPKFGESVVPPHGYFVFELKNKLNNSGDVVQIKDSTGWIMDRFTYNSSSQTQSWSFNNETHDYQLATPTRGEANFFVTPSPSTSPSATPVLSPVPSPQPTASPTASPFTFPTPSPVPSPTPPPISLPLQLSEIVACAESGESEWVELYNPNSYLVALQSWKFKDRTGNLKTFSAELPAHGYQVIEITTSLLNNDGDALYILSNTGTEVAHVELTACSAGQSSIYTSTGWQQTSTPTPLGSNIFTSTSSTSPSPSPYSVSYQETTAISTAEDSSSETSSDISQLLSSVDHTLPYELGAEENVTESVSTDENTALALPSLALLATPSPIVTDLGEVKGASTEEEPEGSSLGKVLAKLFLMILLAISLACLTISGYGFYQWYTERRAKIALETL